MWRSAGTPPDPRVRDPLSPQEFTQLYTTPRRRAIPLIPIAPTLLPTMRRPARARPARRSSRRRWELTHSRHQVLIYHVSSHLEPRGKRCGDARSTRHIRPQHRREMLAWLAWLLHLWLPTAVSSSQEPVSS